MGKFVRNWEITKQIRNGEEQGTVFASMENENSMLMN
jgi:hypothetical protein